MSFSYSFKYTRILTLVSEWYVDSRTLEEKACQRDPPSHTIQSTFLTHPAEHRNILSVRDNSSDKASNAGCIKKFTYYKPLQFCESI